jgi:hypothetical protein
MVASMILLYNTTNNKGGQFNSFILIIITMYMQSCNISILGIYKYG